MSVSRCYLFDKNRDIIISKSPTGRWVIETYNRQKEDDKSNTRYAYIQPLYHLCGLGKSSLACERHPRRQMCQSADKGTKHIPSALDARCITISPWLGGGGSEKSHRAGVDFTAAEGLQPNSCSCACPGFREKKAAMPTSLRAKQ